MRRRKAPLTAHCQAVEEPVARKAQPTLTHRRLIDDGAEPARSNTLIHAEKPRPGEVEKLACAALLTRHHHLFAQFFAKVGGNLFNLRVFKFNR